MKKTIGAVVLMMVFAVLLQSAQENENACPALTVSKTLSQSIDCYKRQYGFVSVKEENFFDFLNRLKTEKKIIQESEALLASKEKLKEKEKAKLVDLLLRLDLSPERFSDVMERERRTIQKLYASRDEKQPEYLQAYYFKELLPSIRMKIDAFFDEMKRSSHKEELQAFEERYLKRFEEIETKARENELLEMYRQKAKKGEALDSASREILSDAMLSLYLRSKEGRISLIEMKNYYMKLKEKRDALVKRLLMR